MQWITESANHVAAQHVSAVEQCKPGTQSVRSLALRSGMHTHEPKPVAAQHHPDRADGWNDAHGSYTRCDATGFTKPPWPQVGSKVTRHHLPHPRPGASRTTRERGAEMKVGEGSGGIDAEPQPAADWSDDSDDESD